MPLEIVIRLFMEFLSRATRVGWANQEQTQTPASQAAEREARAAVMAYFRGEEDHVPFTVNGMIFEIRRVERQRFVVVPRDNPYTIDMPLTVDLSGRVKFAGMEWEKLQSHGLETRLTDKPEVIYGHMPDGEWYLIGGLYVLVDISEAVHIFESNGGSATVFGDEEERYYQLIKRYRKLVG